MIWKTALMLDVIVEKEAEGELSLIISQCAVKLKLPWFSFLLAFKIKTLAFDKAKTHRK